MQVEKKAAVGIDVAIEERGDAAKVLSIETARPCRFGQDLLDHEGVDVDEGDLQQMKRKHTDFLVVCAVRGHLAPFTEEDEIVGAVPVFDDVEALVDITSKLQRSEVAAQENCLLSFAEFCERTVDRVLNIGASEAA